MRIFFAILILCLLPMVAFAGPFLVCDPQAGVTNYKLTGPGWVPASVPAQANGSLRLDLATSTAGTNSLTVAACITDPLWGEACSAAVPFTFTRPASPLDPTNMKLQP